MRSLIHVIFLLCLTGLTGCVNDLPTPAPEEKDIHCAGRDLIKGPPGMQLTDSHFHYYWGDVQVWKEDASAYAHRLATAQRAAEADNRISRPSMRVPKNDGILMFTYEDDAPPFDPNTTMLLGYAHHDGVTMEFKKGTVNRLLNVAQLRATEILGALQARPARVATIPSTSFCVGDGVIALTPQARWHEWAESRGTFSMGDDRYEFLVSIGSLKSIDAMQRDQAARRESVATEAGAVDLPTEDEASTNDDLLLASPHLASRQMLMAEDAEGNPFVIYEWRGPVDTALNNNRVAYLYIWPATGAATQQSSERLLKAVQEGPVERPLWMMLSPLPRAKVAAPLAAQVQEESQVPFSKRLAYSGPQSSASGRRYRFVRDGDVVHEGRSDKNGFTVAMNADYLENWETILLSD